MPRSLARPRALVMVFAIGLSFVPSACKELPQQEPAVCGNGIWEPFAAEDCDGQPGCTAPSDSVACAWSCADGFECPEGFACGPDALCRAPSFELEEGPTLGDAPVLWLDAVDMDDDGRDELLTLEMGPPGRDLLSVNFFAADGTTAERWELEGVQAHPAVADQDGDGRQDLFVPLASGVLPFLQDETRGFSSVAIASAWRERPQPEAWLDAPSPVFLRDGVPWLLDSDTDRLLFPSPSTPQIVDSDQIAFNSTFVLPACYVANAAVAIDGELMALAGDSCPPTPLTLPPDFVSDDRLVFVDVNRDGLDDLVAFGHAAVNTDAALAHVAYGVADGSLDSNPVVPAADGDWAFETTAALRLSMGDESGAILAVGHLDDDEVLDALYRPFGSTVGSTLVAHSTAGCFEEEGCDCGPAHHCYTLTDAAPRAVVRDFTGDGRDDAITVDANGVDVHVNDGARLNTALPAGATVMAADWQGWTVGDFDLNGIADLAITHQQPEAALTSLSILWGNSDAQWVLSTALSDVQLLPGVSSGDGTVAVMAYDDSGSSGMIELDPSSQQLLPQGVSLPIECRGKSLVAGAFYGTKVTVLDQPHAAASCGWEIELVADGLAWESASGAFTRLDGLGVSASVDFFDRVLDLDHDGQPEVVMVGPGSGTTQGWPGSGTVVGVFEADAGLSAAPSRKHEFLGDAPAPLDGAHTGFGVADLDGNGEVDLTVVRRGVESPGRAGLLWNDGQGFVNVELDGGDDVVAFEALGTRDSEGTVVAYVDAQGLHTGTVDGLQLNPMQTRSAPARVRSSVRGDFDGDGLTDLALASDTGAVIYRSIPGRGEDAATDRPVMPVGECGDGVVGELEDCDGDDERSCTEAGRAGVGMVRCGDDCRWDVSSCAGGLEVLWSIPLEGGPREVILTPDGVLVIGFAGGSGGVGWASLVGFDGATSWSREIPEVQSLGGAAWTDEGRLFVQGSSASQLPPTIEVQEWDPADGSTLNSAVLGPPTPGTTNTHFAGELAPAPGGGVYSTSGYNESAPPQPCPRRLNADLTVASETPFPVEGLQRGGNQVARGPNGNGWMPVDRMAPEREWSMWVIPQDDGPVVQVGDTVPGSGACADVVVDESGNAYVACSKGFPVVFKMSPNGSVLWSYEGGASLTGYDAWGLALADDGRIYVALDGGFSASPEQADIDLLVLDVDGHFAGSGNVGVEGGWALVFGPDGGLYLASRNDDGGQLTKLAP